MTFHPDHQHPQPPISLDAAEQLLLRLDDGSIVRVCEMSHEQLYDLCASRMDNRSPQWREMQGVRLDDEFARWHVILELKRLAKLPIVEERVA